ncbi:MAG: DUF2116 family Zn-ribbon domain-containing protein [archaeon]|nr:DUF2116 family Zn-ribbon domain-containing protein [archaeon]
MSPDLAEHDHCRYCGDSVPSDQAYCSLDCYHRHQAILRKERMKEVFWTVAAFAGVVVILALGILF